MIIETGTKLGSYEIISMLGKGGMGEVYRARDTRLKRDVAIKVLSDEVLRDSAYIARFQREAEVLASLNHPHIASIYHVEEAAGSQFLVLELVEGETLADRIARGPIPIDEALGLAGQIAEALEAAHEKGIIHRDLKPANIKLTAVGQVKVLDFGLAKAFVAEATDSSFSNSPTLSLGATRAGIILGTAAYMSPEQARGKNTDRRTDIWAFGCVLYEMLTGKHAFRGDDMTEILASVLKSDPDWTALPAGIPSTVRRLLVRCLQKDIKKRTRDAGDIVIECEEALSAPVATSATGAPVRSGRALLIGLIGIVLGALTAGVAIDRLKPMPTVPVSRFNVILPAGQRLAALTDISVAFSQDGKRLVYVAMAAGVDQLFVREIDSLEARPLAGTEGAYSPFFSPDGLWVGFFTVSKLKKVSINGGSPTALASVYGRGRGGSWGSDGNIVFAPTYNSGLWVVPAAGGAVRELTKLDRQKSEGSHRFPHHLPNSAAVVFTIGTGGTWDNARIAVLKPGATEKTVLLEGGSDARYVSTGHLVYLRAGTLMAVAFDLKELKVTGDSVPLVQGILPSTDNTGAAQAAIADSGALVYLSGKQQATERKLTWVDRKGNEELVQLPPRPYRYPRISADGQRAVLDLDEGNGSDIWTYDISRGTLTRQTFGGQSAFPEWASVGTKVSFQSAKEGPENIYWKTTDNNGVEERLTTSPNFQYTGPSTPDGAVLTFTELDPVTGLDIWTLALKEGRKALPFLQTPFNETCLTFSPDGRWIVYQSDESGRQEIYVQPFPGPASKTLVSTLGGREPMWSRDGREIFYRDGDKVMSVPITVQPTLRASKPEILFERPYLSGAILRMYDESPDGRRFLMIKENDSTATTNSMTIVMNWFEELKRKVPGK